MKQNLYFRTAVRRGNAMSNFILGTAFKLASPARLLIEVFIRRNFGLRYWSTGMALFAIIVMAAAPVIGDGIRSHGYGASMDNSSSFWLHYSSWYAFLLAFIRACRCRQQEVKYSAQVYYGQRVTTYSGDILPGFFKLHPLGHKTTVRAVEIFFEPGVFFVGGLVLWMLSQPLGMLLMIVSIAYGLSYAAAYKQGDDFVMDKMDEMILNEQYEDAFVNDNYNNAQGARYYVSRPHSSALRQKLKDQIIINASDAAIAE